MINVSFYALDESVVKNVVDRFKVDYPNLMHEYNSNEEELTFKNVVQNLEGVDTFLCEEICHEYEVCCCIYDPNTKASKNYYYDEEDEWIYK